MNNSSIFTADRTTHLKIVVVSLVASIAVIAVGLAARTSPPESASLTARAPISGQVVKATKSTVFTQSGDSAVR
jgi:hypothetical protein